VHRKDQNAKRRLLITISRRRRLSKYLKRRDLSTYYAVLKDQVLEDQFLMHDNE
jgi:ribosomal protein S15P/S13E